jgi:hypothetical protein
MIHDCAQFDAWLDEGRDAAQATAAAAHAATCPRCAAAFELESLLGAPPAVEAGAAFTENVLYRVRDAERAHAAARLVRVEPDAAWWLRAPAEPSAALALVVAALLAWRGDGVWAFALRLAAWTRGQDPAHGPGAAVAAFSGHFIGALPANPLALGTLLVLVAAGSFALARVVESLVARPAATRAAAVGAGAALGR